MSPVDRIALKHHLGNAVNFLNLFSIGQGAKSLEQADQARAAAVVIAELVKTATPASEQLLLENK